MLKLADGAIREVEPDDLDRFIVVRVGDEFVVDLMKRSCGIEYTEARNQIECVTIRGVAVPFANVQLLAQSKPTGKRTPLTGHFWPNGLRRKGEEFHLKS